MIPINNNILQLPVRKSTIIYEREDAVKRLKDLGLTIEFLQRVLAKGVKYQAEKPVNAPALEKNLGLWSGTITALRDELCPVGWQKDDKFGFNKTFLPGKYAIAISSGDENVGTQLNPQTKNTKGAVAEAAVEVNNAQQLTLLDFHSYDYVETNNKYSLEDMQHWFLLYYYDKHILKGELSLPNYFDENMQKITGWSERILLPPLTPEEIHQMNYPQLSPLCNNSEEEIIITRKE